MRDYLCSKVRKCTNSNWIHPCLQAKGHSWGASPKRPFIGQTCHLSGWNRTLSDYARETNNISPEQAHVGGVRVFFEKPALWDCHEAIAQWKVGFQLTETESDTVPGLTVLVICFLLVVCTWGKFYPLTKMSMETRLSLLLYKGRAWSFGLSLQWWSSKDEYMNLDMCVTLYVILLWTVLYTFSYWRTQSRVNKIHQVRARRCVHLSWLGLRISMCMLIYVWDCNGFHDGQNWWCTPFTWLYWVKVLRSI